MKTVLDIMPFLRTLSLPKDLEERLLALLTSSPDSLPPELVEALYGLKDLANDKGHDDLLSVGVPRPGPLSAQALALHALLEHPELYRHTLQGRSSRARSFRELPGRIHVPVRRFEPGELDQVADELGLDFQARGRSRHCRIEMITEHRTLSFQITHGRPTRQENSIVEETPQDPDRPFLLHEGQTTYRPQQVDLVIYDPRTGHLKVQGRDATTMRQYARAFGQLLFRDPDWFRVGQVISLGPLAELGALALRPTPGIRSVELVQLKIAVPRQQKTDITLRGQHLLDKLTLLQDIRLVEDDLLSARLRIRYHRGRARSLDLRPPNTLRFDHRRDRIVTLGFLEERGFLSLPLARAEAA